MDAARSIQFITVITAHKRSLRRLCFHKHLSVHSGVMRGMEGVHGREACMAGGHALLGGMCGRGECIAGGCMVEEVCMAGGHVWQGDMCGRGACMAGGMHGRGNVWQGACTAGACVAGGHAWWGACMTGSVHDMHAPSRYYEIWSVSGRYASYWNAFLFWSVTLSVRIFTLRDVSNRSSYYASAGINEK